MIFSDRLKLSEIINQWCTENELQKSALAIISYLDARNALNQKQVSKILKEKGQNT